MAPPLTVFGARREPQEPTAPTDASGKRTVVHEIRLRRRPDGPRLRQAVSQRGAERDIAARNAEFAAQVQRSVGPGSQRFGEFGRCDPRLQVAVHGKQRFAIKRVEYVHGDLFAAASHHEGFREPPGVHVVSAEHMDDLVRDDAQPLLPRGLRRVHPDPARDAIDSQRHVRVGAG